LFKQGQATAAEYLFLNNYFVGFFSRLDQTVAQSMVGYLNCMYGRQKKAVSAMRKKPLQKGF
jgi:hypothetical protein